MQIKILFITNCYFFQPTIDALSRIKPKADTKVVSYDCFDRIPQIYDNYAKDYDVVLITGTSAKHVLDLQYPNNPKPVIAYQVDSDRLHRDILRLAIETQNLDFSRIAVDFLVPLEGGYSVVDFLNLNSMKPVILQNQQLTEQVRKSSLQSLESVILDQIKLLWEEKSIDMVICLYASIVPSLQELGIPFRCPFISDDDLSQLIQDALVKAELIKLHNNHPAIIQLFPRNISEHSKEQFQQMHKLVQQYIHDHLLDCVLRENDNCLVLISSMQILRFLTNDFQICRLSSWLSEHLDFSIAIGYGVGTTISHAMNNVQIASKEAKLAGQPFVVDTNGTLIGPLNSDRRLVIPNQNLANISDIAKRCSLSAMTIQKLQSIVHNSGTNKITIPEMAQKLNTSIRNANRIMLNLCQGNVAQPVYTQSTHSRGRPIQVYVLDFDTV